MVNELFNTQNVFLASPLLVLILGAVFILMVGSFANFSRRFYSTFSILFILAALVLTCMFDLNILVAKPLFFGSLVSDGYGFFANIIIMVFSILYLLAEKNDLQAEYYSLFLFMIASFVLMVGSTNLIMIFLGLEGSSLSLFTLIALRGSKNSISSALKYFSMAALGSGFFVLASAFVYYKTGSLQLDMIAKHSFVGDPVMLTAGVLFLIIFGIKLSLMPFHYWIKPVYFAAYSNLVAFISVVPKLAILIAMLRVFSSLNLGLDFELLLCIIAVISLMGSAIFALSQKDVKKFFAYSSISHSAFAFAAIISIISSLNGKSLDFELVSMISLFAYWFIFAFSNYGVFIILSLFKEHSYESMNGLYSKHPALALLIAIFVLSLAGIPPFGVFWGKALILFSVLSEHHIALAIFMALSSAVILYAYLKILISMFFKKATRPVFTSTLVWPQKIALCICIAGSLFAIILLV